MSPPSVEAHETVLTGAPAQFTVRLVTRAQGHKWTSMTLQAVRDDDGAAVGSVGGWRDVHAEYEARRALEESEAHFRAVADSAADAIVTADLRGVIRGWNAAAERIFGYSEDEAVGRPVTMIMPERYRAGHPAALRRVLEGSERRVMGTVVELEGRRRDGTEFSIDLSMAEWTVGEERFVTTIIRDATERREAAAEIERLNTDLERRIAERTHELSLAIAELEELVYAIAHDLRTPLRSLAGFSEIVSADYRDAVDETGRDYLGRIHAAASHMGEVMDSLLALSRVSRGPARRERRRPERTGAGGGVQPAQGGAGARRRARDRGRVGRRGGRGVVQGPAGEPLGERLEVHGRSTLAHISVRAVGLGGRRVFCVSDDGAGFDQQYAGRLFRPFERLHAPEDFTGAGIGLATVRRIVRRFGGDCWAQGMVGEGASFFFTLSATGASSGDPIGASGFGAPDSGGPPMRPGDRSGSRPPGAGDVAQGQCSDALQALVDANEQPVFALDRDLRYTAFNRAHATVMRALYGVEIALGGRLPDYQTVAADRDAAVGNLARALAGEHLTARAFSGEGERRRDFEVVHTPQLDAAGAVVGVVVRATTSPTGSARRMPCVSVTRGWASSSTRRRP